MLTHACLWGDGLRAEPPRWGVLPAPPYPGEEVVGPGSTPSLSAPPFPTRARSLWQGNQVNPPWRNVRLSCADPRAGPWGRWPWWGWLGELMILSEGQAGNGVSWQTAGYGRGVLRSITISLYPGPREGREGRPRWGRHRLVPIPPSVPILPTTTC